MQKEKTVLEKKNDLGTIKLNDYVFAQIVQKAIAGCRGRAFPASEKGKLLGNQGMKSGLGDLLSNMKITSVGGRYRLEFRIIMQFGASISETTREILDYIEYEMKGLFPDDGGIIVLTIVGIRSKKIAERNIRVTREYEAVSGA